MELFLSYPSEHLKVAREVYAFLQSVNVNTWFDKAGLIAGQDWDRERKAAQKRADLTILICSRETIERAGVIQREVQDILDLLQERPIGDIYLVSVRVEDIRLPPELAKYQYVNYFEPDWRVQLGRSIELKCQQMGILPSAELIKFFQSSQLPEIRTIKSFRESTDALDSESEFFTYNLDGDYWSYINANIISLVFGRIYRARSDFGGELPLDPKNRWSMRVEEFFRSGELVSIRTSVSWYWSGAAHNEYGYSSINFGGSTCGKIGLRELLDGSAGTADFLKYCEIDLRRQLIEYEPVEFLSYPKNAEEAWKAFGEFNFDNHGLTINFSPCEILAFAFGPQEVHIPWLMLRDKINTRLFVSGALGAMILGTPS